MEPARPFSFSFPLFFFIFGLGFWCGNVRNTRLLATFNKRKRKIVACPADHTYTTGVKCEYHLVIDWT